MILRETIKRIFFWIFALTSHVTYSPVCSNCFLMRCSDYAEFTPLQMKASWKPIWSFYLQTLHPPPHPFVALTYSQLDNHFFANALLITQNLTLFYFVYMNIFHKIVESPSPDQFPSDCGKGDCGAGSDEGTSFHCQLGATSDPLSLGRCSSPRRSTAGSLPFAHAQTVMTEAINVVMRVWHPRHYFLQGLSNFSENVRSGHKSAFSLPITKHLDLENLVV